MEPERGRSRTMERRERLAALFLLGQIVDQHVLAQMVWSGVERATVVDLRHLLHERAEAWRVIEHEGVDGDALAGAAFHFLQGFLRGAHADSAERQGPFAVEALVEEVGGRLSVSNHDDVLIARRMAPEQVRGESQSILEVGKWVA